MIPRYFIDVDRWLRFGAKVVLRRDDERVVLGRWLRRSSAWASAAAVVRVAGAELADTRDEGHMSPEDIDNRFTYHPPTPDQVPVYEEIRRQAREFAHWLNDTVPESREKSLAVTHLEIAVMQANAAVARHGLPAVKSD